MEATEALIKHHHMYLQMKTKGEGWTGVCQNNLHSLREILKDHPPILSGNNSCAILSSYLSNLFELFLH